MSGDYRQSIENIGYQDSNSDSNYSLFTKSTYLTFYHASEVEVREPQWDYAQTIMNKNEADLRDFGLGFYTCLNIEYPLKLASNKDSLVLNTYNANLEGLRYIEFGLDLEWLLSIGFHRRDLSSRKWCHTLRDRCRNWLSGCDVAIGIISNDKTYSAIEGFLDNTMTDEAAIAMVNAADYGKQYVFKSNAACERLRDGFRGSTEYLPDQIGRYREQFISEKAEYAGKADRLRMDITRRGGGEFFEDIVLEGLFHGRVRF
jgi:hypothetical protein